MTWLRLHSPGVTGVTPGAAQGNAKRPSGPLHSCSFIASHMLLITKYACSLDTDLSSFHTCMPDKGQHKVDVNLGSRARPPGFESQICLLLPMSP